VKFRPKVVDVDAVQWDGEISDLIDAFDGPDTKMPFTVNYNPWGISLSLELPSGNLHPIAKGQWIVRRDYTYYVLDADAFHHSYVPVENDR
jgi:hypothetical protein